MADAQKCVRPRRHNASRSLHVVLNVEVLLQRPVDKLVEEDLSAAVGVDLVELRVHVRDLAHPLLHRRLDGGGGELLLGDAVVVAGVDPGTWEEEKSEV